MILFCEDSWILGNFLFSLTYCDENNYGLNGIQDARKFVKRLIQKQH